MYQDFIVGQRILVCGVTGSGKSTLGRALGEALGLPVIELDALHWRIPGWVEPAAAAFRADVAAAIEEAGEGWVCDGNYTSKLGDLISSRADTIIFLNLPWRVTFWRLLKRTLPRSLKGELLWGTQRETLRQNLLSKNSILWWSITHHRAAVTSGRLALRESPHARVYELRTSRQVLQLLTAARSEVSSPGEARAR